MELSYCKPEQICTKVFNIYVLVVFEIKSNIGINGSGNKIYKLLFCLQMKDRKLAPAPPKVPLPRELMLEDIRSEPRLNPTPGRHSK